MSGENQNNNFEDILSTWMKSTDDFWSMWTQTWSDLGGPFAALGKAETDASRKAGISVEAMKKSFQAFSSAMSDAKATESLLKGTGAMPGILAKMAQSAMSGLMQFQEKWTERIGRIGKSAEAYKFEAIDENAFRAWTEIYENEFRQFFNIPQLGLTRFYQERMNQAMDKYNIFQANFSEFLRLLYLPYVRSFSVLQDKLTEMMEAGQLPEDAKAYHQLWIKVLEGHYMRLFQSPEYIKTLGKTLKSMSEFSAVKDKLLEDILGSLPVPKQSEMDELYKELIQLKKRIKKLENQKP